MEATKSINSLVSIVMRQLSERNYSTGSKYQYQSVYGRLKKFAKSNHKEEYSTELGEQFLQLLKSNYKGKNCRHMEDAKTAISRLNDCLMDENLFNVTHCVHSIPEQSIFDDKLNEYKQYLVCKGISENSIRYRELVISRFLKYLEENGATKLSQIKIQYFNETFKKADSKTDYSSGMKSFMQYAYKQGWVPVDYTFIIPTLPKKQPLPTIYTPQEIENMLSIIDRSSMIGKRDYAILLIAARLGLRVSDIVNLTPANLVNDNINLVQVKTKKALKLLLLSEIKEAVQDYYDNARPICESEKIFISCDAPYNPLTRGAINYQLKKYYEAANITISHKKHGIHTLRSSLASALLEEDNSYSTLQQILGHDNAEMMKHYAKIDINRLRDCALPVRSPSGLFQEYLITGRWAK